MQLWEGSFHPATDLSLQLTGPATRAVSALNYSGASRPLPHLFLSLHMPDCQCRPQRLCQGVADLRAPEPWPVQLGPLQEDGVVGTELGVREREHPCEHGCGNVAAHVKRDCVHGTGIDSE